jgi:organic hydroperoxide reductase OsmC/OhrA
MRINPDGSGGFTSVVLRPEVVVAEPSMIERAQSIHVEAHEKCFIARSVNFPVSHEPTATPAAGPNR